MQSKKKMLNVVKFLDIIHSFKKGENLDYISKYYNVSKNEIIKYNYLTEKKLIIGMEIKIPIWQYFIKIDC